MNTGLVFEISYLNLIIFNNRKNNVAEEKTIIYIYVCVFTLLFLTKYNDYQAEIRFPMFVLKSRVLYLRE